MNNQEIFNTVVTHLRRQGVPAEVEGNCGYRAQESDKSPILMCAVGCLIKDEFYYEGLEGCCAYEQSVLEAVSLSLDTDIDEDKQKLLTKLQQCHDVYEPYEWEDKFKQIAKKFNLTVPPLPM